MGLRTQRLELELIPALRPLSPLRKGHVLRIAQTHLRKIFSKVQETFSRATSKE
jgi:hypothetical protein